MLKDNFTIGSYKVHPGTRTIMVDEESIQLQPKVMDLLCYLAAHANKVISRDELVENVWKGTVISDDAIHRTISILRTALRDNPKKPKYLETITKTGYRLIADIQLSEDSADNITNSGKSHTPLIPVLFVSVLVIATGVAFWFYNSRQETVQRLISIPRLSYLTSHNGLEYAPQISPDNKQILYMQYKQGWEGNYLIETKTGSTAKKLDIENHYIDSVWAPDGKSVYSHENVSEFCHITRHYLSGLPSQIIGDCITNNTGMFFYMDVTPDNKFIFTSERDHNTPRRLYKIDVQNGARNTFLKSDEGVGDYSPKVSPDNQWLAFTRGFTANSRELMLVPVSGGEPLKLTNDSAYIQDLDWTADNRIVFISNRESGTNGLWMMDIENKQPQWLNIMIDDINRFDISHDNSFLAYQTWYQPFNIYQVGLNQLNPEKKDIMYEAKALSDSKKTNTFPSISPDGKYVAYTSDKTGHNSLWIADTNGNNHRLLVDNVYKFSAPSWSADSRQIAFTHLNNDQGDICITNLNGDFSCISDSGEDELFPTWSDDMSAVYYTKLEKQDHSETTYINYRYNLKSGITEPSGLGNALNVLQKSEGIFYYNEAVSSRIYQFDSKTNEKTLLVDDFHDVYYKSWDVTEKGIYYYNKDKDLSFYRFDTAEITPLIKVGRIGGYDTTSGLQVNEENQTLTLSLSPMTLNGDIGLVENFADLLPEK